MTDRIDHSGAALGAYLKDRRARIDPAAFGLPATRRRTPGLRREEVANRAHISPTWYTCLEQGRGGAPSADVLDRIARALLLTDAEREHMFLLGLGHPPELRYRRDEDVSPRLQRVLDVLDPCPAVLRTATWDVVGWNRAATVLLSDFSALPPAERNILRRTFLDPNSRNAQYDWLRTARFIVAAFRMDVARAGAAAEVEPMIEELRRLSPDFDAVWRDNDVIGPHGDGIKHIRHPVLGPIAFEYSVFAVDGRFDLSLVTYNPATAEERERMAALVGS